MRAGRIINPRFMGAFFGIASMPGKNAYGSAGTDDGVCSSIVESRVLVRIDVIESRCAESRRMAWGEAVIAKTMLPERSLWSFDVARSR